MTRRPPRSPLFPYPTLSRSNKRALESGYDLKPLEERVEMRLEITRQRPPIVNLAATMCLEHFTAIIPHHLLKDRSEEHTSELQSRQYIVCSLLLDKYMIAGG